MGHKAQERDFGPIVPKIQIPIFRLARCLWHDYAINMNKYALETRITKFEEFKSWLRDGKKTHTKALRHEEFGMIIKHEFPRINHK